MGKDRSRQVDRNVYLCPRQEERRVVIESQVLEPATSPGACAGPGTGGTPMADGTAASAEWSFEVPDELDVFMRVYSVLGFWVRLSVWGRSVPDSLSDGRLGQRAIGNSARADATAPGPLERLPVGQFGPPDPSLVRVALASHDRNNVESSYASTGSSGSDTGGAPRPSSDQTRYCGTGSASCGGADGVGASLDDDAPVEPDGTSGSSSTRKSSTVSQYFVSQLSPEETALHPKRSSATREGHEA